MPNCETCPYRNTIRDNNRILKSITKCTRHLDESTRKETVIYNDKAYAMHILDDEVIITDSKDFFKIYAIYSKDFYFDE